MEFLNPQITFDPTKPFYGLVVSYLSQLHGFVELCSRGLSLQLDGIPEATLAAMSSGEVEVKAREALNRIFAGGRTGLLGEQQLASVTSSALKVDIDLLAKTLLVDYEAALQHFNEVAAGGTLIVAWAITGAFHTTDPLWEFLRHCRNAAAHRGHFHLLNGEPRRPAVWRGLQVTRAMHGSLLLRDPRRPGFLDPADVIYLLADIEGTYPGIQ